MRNLSLTLGVFLLLAFKTVAQYDLPSLPDCAQSCFTSAVANSTCISLKDTACACGTSFLDPVKSCIADICGRKDALGAFNATDIACGVPTRDRSDMYFVVTTVFFALAAASMISRFAIRVMYGRTLWYDDVTMVVILMIDTALYYVAVVMSKDGLGKDIWKVPFHLITLVTYFFWISEMLYFGSLSVVKVGFLIFFLHIFPEKRFRKIIWGVIAVNLMMGLSFVLVALFSCHPISYVWNQWDGEHQGKCFNINAMAFSHAAFSILLDIVTLALPVTQIWKLQLATKKKIGVLIMFSVGAFVTIVSILRLQALVHYANTANVTWDFLQASLWSIIEVNVGIVCLCMPAIRLGLVRAFPTLLGSTNQSTSKTPHIGTNGMPTNTGIAVSTSYKVMTAKRPQVNDESSFVQLVEIGAADNKSTETINTGTDPQGPQ